VVPAFSAVPRVAVATGSHSITFTVLLLAGRLLLDRPAPLKGLWPAAAAGAVAVTLMLQLGAIVLPELVRRAGPVDGSFATVAGLFTLLYAVSLALVYAVEMAVVRRSRLWPRAVDRGSPTAADLRALELLAREQERLPGERIVLRRVRHPT